MKRLLPVFCAFLMGCAIMVGCAGNQQSSSESSESSSSQQSSTSESKDSSASEASDEVQMITVSDLHDEMGEGDALVIVDLRKAADYEAGHIPGAISADMDAAKNGDIALGEETMKDALLAATGSETGGDDKLVLVCYTGNAYAKAGREVLEAMGADMANVYTLEGGMKAWTEQYPDDITTDPSPLAPDAS